MRRWILTGVFALVAAGLIGGQAMAADPTAKPAKDKASRQAKMLKKWDKNGDGKLDDTELAAMKAAKKSAREGRAAKHHAAMLKKWDKNGDGKLDDTEKAAMKAAKQAKAAAHKKGGHKGSHKGGRKGAGKAGSSMSEPVMTV